MIVGERPAYLTIELSTGQQLTFVLPGEFSVGYTNELDALRVPRRTHPQRHDWLRGTMDDVELELELVVGVSYGIETSERLIRYIETLYAMALPRSAGRPQIDTVRVFVHGGGQSWFQQDYFIVSVRAGMGAPYDIDNARPMRAKMRLNLRPTYTSGESAMTAPLRDLPNRPYSFISRG